jgi:uracil-DNA glycosylase
MKYKSNLFETKITPLSDNRTIDPNLTLIDLWEKTLNCHKCELAKLRTKTTIARGETENPLVFIIGEAPGETEDKEGLTMVGKSGQLLDLMLESVGLNDKCYISNVIRCRPPNNRTPQKQEINSCFGYLELEIKLLQPKAILCLGATATHTLLDTKIKFNKLRGKVFNYYEYPTFCTYHPAYLLRNPSLSYNSPKWQTWEDLCQLKLFVGR